MAFDRLHVQGDYSKTTISKPSARTRWRLAVGQPNLLVLENKVLHREVVNVLVNVFTEHKGLTILVKIREVSNIVCLRKLPDLSTLQPVSTRPSYSGKYTEALIKSSRRLRERSLSPPPRGLP